MHSVCERLAAVPSGSTIARSEGSGALSAGLVGGVQDRSTQPRSHQVFHMIKSSTPPVEGVYRGTTTITLNGMLLRPGQRLPSS
jgi:hypothetical protein